MSLNHGNIKQQRIICNYYNHSISMGLVFEHKYVIKYHISIIGYTSEELKSRWVPVLQTHEGQSWLSTVDSV